MTEPMPLPKGKLEKEFEKYHENNPRVYQLVKNYAWAAIRAGHDKYSMSAIWELIRWEIVVRTKDVDFKMPNNHRAYYARLWLKDHPEFAGAHPFFKLNRLRSVWPGKVDRFGRDRPPGEED